MSHMTPRRHGPSPQAAYAQWVATCAQAGWHPGPVIEQVPLHDALGRVSATAACARWPSPRFDCAAMDGIAITTGGLPDRGLADGGQVLLPGSAFAWVDTGDTLPAGADTVVERERVEPCPGGVLVTGPVKRGQ